MHLSYLCVSALLLTAHLVTCFPTGMTERDATLLKDLLSKLEESISEQTDVDVQAPERDVQDTEDTLDLQQPQTDLDEAMIREFLSAKNLKRTKNNSNKSSSGCFGRRMDRIGSMTSLGCNTVGKYNPKSP